MEEVAFMRAELELELIQPLMAQKPVLRGEVGACSLRVRSVSMPSGRAFPVIDSYCVYSKAAVY